MARPASAAPAPSRRSREGVPVEPAARVLPSIDLNQRLLWVGCLFILAGIGISVRDTLLGQAGVVLALIAIPTGAGLGLWCVLNTATGRDPGLSFRVYSGWSLGLLVVATLCVSPQMDPTSYPAVWPMALIGCLTLPLAWGYTTTLAVTPGIALMVFLQRSQATSTVQAVGEAWINAAAFVTVALLFRLLHRCVDRMTRSVAAAARVREERERQELLAREEQRWNSLLHDKILGSLQLGTRLPSWSTSASGADLAKEAILALSESSNLHHEDLPVFILSVADSLGLTVGVHGAVGRAHPEVEAALRVCVAEALTNVSRHSGQRRADVHLAHDDEGIRAVVSDPGRGFDPSTVGSTRAGIAIVLSGTAESVGGRAVVAATVGLGTTVMLTFPHFGEPSVYAPVWDDGDLRAALWVGAAGIWGYWIVSLAYLDTNRSAVVAFIGGATTVSLALWHATRTRTPKWDIPVLTASAAVIPIVLHWNLIDPAPQDWRTWYVGAQNYALAMVTLRGGTRLGLAVVGTLTIGLPMAAYVSSGDPTLDTVLAIIPWLLIWVLGVGRLRSTLDLVATTLSYTTSRELADIIETERASIRAATLRTRSVGLNAMVVPTLTRLAIEADLSPTERSECARLSDATRDELVAWDLLDDHLRAILTEARRLGVGAEVSCVPGATGPVLAGFRGCLAAVLVIARPGSVIRADWVGTPLLSATLTLVANTPEAMPSTAELRGVEGVIKSSLAGVDCELSTSFDEDSLLVILRPM